MTLKALTWPLASALCLSLVIGPWGVSLAAQSTDSWATVDRVVEAERQKQALVGVAIGIIRDGKVVYTRGYGLANRETNSPVTTASVFNWASNSKPLAAVAAIQLVEQGLLDLDIDIRNYVPEYPDPGAAITTRQLLCHQSGIPHYRNGRVQGTELPADDVETSRDPVVALRRFNRSPLLFTPGTKTDYSSYAYVLLSAVIQRAGNAPFDEQIQQRIKRPLKLTTLELDGAWTGQADWVQGYVKRGDDGIIPAPEEAHAWKAGAGGYKSNIKDFAAWAAALLHQDFLSDPSRTQLWTPQSLTDGRKTTWGLGFVVEHQRGPKVSHNGSQTETTTRMVLYPDSRSGVVVMTNCEFGKPTEISTAIFQVLK